MKHLPCIKQFVLGVFAFRSQYIKWWRLNIMRNSCLLNCWSLLL